MASSLKSLSKRGPAVAVAAVTSPLKVHEGGRKQRRYASRRTARVASYCRACSSPAGGTAKSQAYRECSVPASAVLHGHTTATPSASRMRRTGRGVLREPFSNLKILVARCTLACAACHSNDDRTNEQVRATHRPNWTATKAEFHRDHPTNRWMLASAASITSSQTGPYQPGLTPRTIIHSPVTLPIPEERPLVYVTSDDSAEKADSAPYCASDRNRRRPDTPVSPSSSSNPRRPRSNFQPTSPSEPMAEFVNYDALDSFCGACFGGGLPAQQHLFAKRAKRNSWTLRAAIRKSVDWRQRQS